MKVTDPIADLLTRIRNAIMARKNMVDIPYSKLKEAICDVLKENKYIENVSVVGEGIERMLQVELKEELGELHLKRVSKPGQRIYVGSQEIPRVLDGLGLAIISTPKGVMSGQKARKMKVGGEYLCEVY